jgi:hypothetical protein
MLEGLNLSDFDVSSIVNKKHIAVIGLGATGSAFLPHLAHFIRYNSGYSIDLYDFDVLEDHNNRVSMYLFDDLLSSGRLKDNSKVSHALAMLQNLITNDVLTSQQLDLQAYNEKVDLKVLNDIHNRCGSDRINYVFVFGDNSEVRYQIALYHLIFPNSVILDVRIGTYREFEIIVSRNPELYLKSLPLDENEQIIHIETNQVCLDERMSFSIAQASSALLSNAFTQLQREQLPFSNGLYHYLHSVEYKGVLRYD